MQKKVKIMFNSIQNAREITCMHQRANTKSNSMQDAMVVTCMQMEGQRGKLGLHTELSLGLFIAPKCVKSQNQLPFHTIKKKIFHQSTWNNKPPNKWLYYKFELLAFQLSNSCDVFIPSLIKLSPVSPKWHRNSSKIPKTESKKKPLGILCAARMLKY